MKRTHYCGGIRKTDIGKEAVLLGWVNSVRDHGELLFVDLRDREGAAQIVFNPAKDRNLHTKAQGLRSEFVVCVKGVVRERPEGTKNEKIDTGEVEIEARELEVLNKSAAIPFEISDSAAVTDELRLKYRYLDLRRPKMLEGLVTRHKVSKIMRDYLDRHGFIEVETPVLTKSTPEGARDYLVPSRLNPGLFYALPQSPQLFKQLLMVSGLDRYFQIAKCFRDEDLRKDRQPEFTQLDIEMSFVDEDDIFAMCEGLIAKLFREIKGRDIKIPFPRLKYSEARTRFGTDKPDSRFGMELVDIRDEVKNCNFQVFKKALGEGGRVLAICAKNPKDFTRAKIDSLIEYVKTCGAKGLAWFKVEDSKLRSNISKFFSEAELRAIKKACGADNGDIIFACAGKEEEAFFAIDNARRKLGEGLSLIDNDKFNFLWLVDFPLFNYNADEKRWESEHHPFTSCRPEDEAFLENERDFKKIRARSFDLVVNGMEIASGSIRIHREEVQEKVFKIIGLAKHEAQKRFGFLLEAFKFGAPPHGGIAFGLDRLMTLFTGTETIRDVIAFPKTQKAYCPLTDAPSEVDERQLRELHIKKTP